MMHERLNPLQVRLMDLIRPFEGDIDFFGGHIRRMTRKQFNQYQPEIDHNNQRQIQFNNMMEGNEIPNIDVLAYYCLLYTSPSPRDRTRSRMPSSA